jgi:hypothetical protein
MAQPDAPIRLMSGDACLRLPHDGARSNGSAMLLEQHDESSLNRGYAQLEVLQMLTDTVPARPSAVAR